MEKIYHKINQAGTASLVCGVIAVVVGVATGVVLIVNGARLLATKVTISIPRKRSN